MIINMLILHMLFLDSACSRLFILEEVPDFVPAQLTVGVQIHLLEGLTKEFFSLFGVCCRKDFIFSILISFLTVNVESNELRSFNEAALVYIAQGIELLASAFVCNWWHA
jgi:hypothetical protein